MSKEKKRSVSVAGNIWELIKDFLGRIFLFRGTYFDFFMLFIVITLVGLGVLMVYSTSSTTAFITHGDSGYYVKRQLIFAAAGGVLMLFVSCIRYQILKNKIVQGAIYVVTIGMFVYMYMQGGSLNGSTRWIKLGPLSIQPSEVAKVVIIIMTAFLFSEYSAHLRITLSSFKHLPVYFIMLPPLLLAGINIKESLTATGICALIIFGMFFIATPDRRIFLFIIPLGIIGLIAGINLFSYRVDRIDAWLHPEEAKNGFQVLQSLYAIANGGMFGRGLGQSVQVSVLPEAYNDMIFAVICEEMGFVGAFGIIILFIILLWRIKFIAEGAPDRFGAFLAIGSIIHIGLQTAINIGVVTNTLPNTGVTLPFISYGGSSLVMTMAEMGIILAVSKQIVPVSVLRERKERRKRQEESIGDMDRRQAKRQRARGRVR